MTQDVPTEFTTEELRENIFKVSEDSIDDQDLHDAMLGLVRGVLILDPNTNNYEHSQVIEEMVKAICVMDDACDTESVIQRDDGSLTLSPVPKPETDTDR